jgi:hypothetical protein
MSLSEIVNTYYNHLAFSLFISKKFAAGAFKSVINGFFPGYFPTSSSELIYEINHILREQNENSSIHTPSPVNTTPIETDNEVSNLSEIDSKN